MMCVPIVDDTLGAALAREPVAETTLRHTRCDSQARHKVVGHGPDGGLPVERRPHCLDATDERDAHDQKDIQPVNVFVPILLRHRCFCDVFLRRIVGLVAVRF